MFDSKDSIQLIMSLASESLASRMKQAEKYDEFDAAILIANVLYAVDYLHSKNIVHRNINLHNILLKSKLSCTDIMLSGFSLATVSPSD